MGNNYNVDRVHEQVEGQPLWGRRILFTGASHGAGLAIARMAHSLGASVALGASSDESFQKAVPLFGNDRVMPFVADFREPANAMNQTHELIDGLGWIPTDIVFAAAAGLDSVLESVFRDVVKLQDIHGQDRTDALSVIKSKIQSLISDSYPRAFDINSASHKIIISQLFEHLQPGSRVIFLSSLYSDLYGRDDFVVPDFYQGVAKSKHDFIEYLSEVAPKCREKGIGVTILSGHLLSDTPAAKILIKLGKRLPDVIYFPDDLNLPETSDIAKEAESLLLSDPQTWRVPHFRYVVAKGKVLDSITPDLPELARIQIKL